MKRIIIILFNWMLWVSIIKFKYTTDKLAKFRKSVSHKVCYSKYMSFLKFKISLTQSLSNRLVFKSSFLRSYKNLRFYYINLLRGNLLKNKYINGGMYAWDNFNTKEFVLAYSQHKSMNDLDYSLFWKGVQVNSLFNVKTQTTKVRKKNIHKQHVYFISGFKRLLFVWRWLAASINCLYVNDVPRKFTLIPGFGNFLLSKNKNDIVYKYKLNVYKLKLIRIL